MNTKKIGNMGEALALSKFISLGLPVYLPFGDNEKADLVVEFNGKLNKVQVKSTNEVKDGCYKIDLRNCKNHTCCVNPRQTYSPDEIDYFVTCCIPRNTVCIFKVDDLLGKNTIKLRFSDTLNSQAANVNLEKDYLVETFFDNLNR